MRLPLLLVVVLSVNPIGHLLHCFIEFHIPTGLVPSPKVMVMVVVVVGLLLL